MGLRVVQHILGARQGIRYVGAVDPAPGLEGRDLGELAGFSPVRVRVGGDASRLFAETGPDIAIYTTVSSLRTFLPRSEAAVCRGVNVVSTCEELAFPAYVDAGMTAEHDELCKLHGVTMLGTGINPGFLMDLRPALLSAACTEVRRIAVTR